MAVVRADVDALAEYIATNLSGSPTAENIAVAIQAYIASIDPSDIPLSSVSVDYEVNKAEMEAILAAKNTWKDITTAGTGQTLLQMIATALTYNQYSIVRSAQETMLPTAIIDSSIYTASQHLGVRLSRRIPAAMTVTLTRTSGTLSATIDAYSQFIAANTYLFNREAITFAIGVTSVSATLYEGQVQSGEFTSDGSLYQTYEFGGSDYTISDVDVVVLVNNIEWSRTAYQTYFSTGLWEYNSGSQVYWDETTPDGNVKVVFGNGVNGVIPSAGSTITIKYATTNGAAGNADISTNTITCTTLPDIGGIVTGAAADGSDEKSASEYKTLAPGLFFAKYRAVNRADHAAIARRYPGVVDAIFEGQQELAPGDLTYMMVMRATILSNPSWGSTGSTAWDNFIAWFENLGIANMVILRQNPSAVTINIDADVYIKPAAASLTAIQNLITANLKAAFALRAGILGYSRYLSDIENIIQDSDPAIDYFILNDPTADTVVDLFEYVTLGSISLTMHYSNRSTLS